MARQMMKCSRCGRRFDLGAGGGFDRKTLLYFCPDCIRSARVKTPSLGGTIAKLATGALFAAVSFQEPDGGDRFTFILVGMVLALSMIAWGLIPWLQVRRERRRLSAMVEQVQKEAAREREEKENERRICPSCGAPTRGRVCEYCGSPLPVDGE